MNKITPPIQQKHSVWEKGYIDFKDLRCLLKADLNRYYPVYRLSKRKVGMCFVKAMLLNEFYPFNFWLRMAQYTERKRGLLFSPFRILTKIVYRSKKKHYGIQIPPFTQIEGGVKFAHYSCIVFAGEASIGNNCCVHQGVTIGRITNGKKEGCPRVGDNVILYPGCKVIGNIKVGNNVVVAANAVLNSDVPDNCIVAGIPAKIISTDTSNVVGEEWHDFLYGYDNNPFDL